MMQTNYFGAVWCTQAVLPQMLARRRGTIVNVASIAGIMGYARMGGYCATKFAMIGFSETLRDEVLGRGVRVAMVCPGTVETRLLRQSRTRQDAGRVAADAGHQAGEAWRRRSPMPPRMGSTGAFCQSARCCSCA